jgi:predicted metal-dependent hydrolase
VQQARRLVAERIAHLNHAYGYTVGKVAIRKQKSRWGSCSKLGNLNFNVRLVFLPEHLVDYVIVHELCHLGEFNHSKAFWNLVARTVPKHTQFRKELRHYAF